MPETPLNPFLFLEANAQRDPDGVFSRSVDASVSNGEALVLAKQLAYEMRRLGVRPGDLIALELPDQLAVLVTEAAYHEGAVTTVIPDGFEPADVVTIDWTFSTRATARHATAHHVLVDSHFLQAVHQNPYGIRPHAASTEAVRIVFSSGTTGTPHAIPLNRPAMQAFDDALETWFQGDPFLVLMDFGTPWGFGGFFLSVKGGLPFLVAGGAGQPELVRLAADNAATSLKGSPAQIAALVDELEAQGRTLPAVETVFFGGTVMPPGLAQRVRRAMEGCEIYGMYGSTEATIATSRLYESDDPSDAGRILPGSEIEIVDEDDRPVPVGEPGRIRHRSAGMIHAYLGDPDATRQAFRDGWFYSGDLGLIRPDGGLTLTGRESEVLNAGGVKIDPNRLDHAALRHPHVLDACSFETDDADGVRRIGMAIVTEVGFDAQSLVDALTAEFRGAAPVWLARVDSIPRNVMGKPMRRELATTYRRDGSV